MADNIYSGLKGIPIDYLVSAPLMAAARANLALADNMLEFINAIAYKGGKPDGGTQLLEFTLERPFTNPNTGLVEKETFTVSAPLIGLVTIPSLLVDNVTIDFTTEVTTSEQNKSDVSASLSAKYGFGAFSVTGTVATSISNTRSTDNTAKYTFHVQANQQPSTEGMSKLMDVMASVIAPLPAGGK